jgi:hypothetical protein
MALKRPTIAPTEGLLTGAMLKHACVLRTAALDPKLTFREDPVSAQVRRSAGPPDRPINQLSLLYATRDPGL